MEIDGHCHCGRISFEAEVDPNAVTICHCTDCQTLTGSAFRANISAPAVRFVLRSGTPVAAAPERPGHGVEFDWQGLETVRES